MTTEKTIAQHLSMNNEEYYNMYLTRYMKWLEGYSSDDIDFQKLLANKAVNSYYTYQHNDLEHQALEVLRRQAGFVTLETKKRMYEAVMVDINRYYPKPLFDAARKLSINGNLN